jgi:hypothetical protein
MAFQNMIQETLGAIPGANLGLVKSKLNEAFEAIQNENIFSFQLKTGGWLAPGLLGGQVAAFLSPGTISIQPFTDQMTGDAVATAAWVGANQPIITQYQIRVPYYSLYSIVAIGGNGQIAYATIFTAGSSQTPGTYTVAVLDNGGPGTGGSVSITVGENGTVSSQPVLISAGSGYSSPFINFSEGGTPATFVVQQIAVLTLDRPWMEPAQPPGSGYLSYQAYFPSPAGFKEWYYIVDTTNNNTMDWWTLSQIDLSEQDPQRTDFSQPEYVVHYGPDIRIGSATFGQYLWELWEGPISQLPYTFGCKCNWPALVKPSDSLPFPLTEELVKLRAFEMLSLWKEANKGDDMERGSGANWQFLTKAYHEEYKDRLKLCRNMDRNIVDLYFTRMRRTSPQEPFASVGGQLNVGS